MGSRELYYTQCPVCTAVLQVEQRLLSSDDTRVRCGECLAVFNASEYLLGDGTTHAQTQDELFDSWAEQTLSDVSPNLLAELEASLQAKQQEPAPPPSFRPNVAAPSAQLPPAPPRPAASAPAPTPQPSSPQQAPATSSEPRQSAFQAQQSGHRTERAEDTGLLRLVTGVALVILLLVALGTLILNRTSLAQTEVRPLVVFSCAIFGCEVPPRKDLTLINHSQHEVRTHPTIKGALMIYVRLVNKADFAQTYPNLVITMNNADGKMVARGRFEPKSYLPNFRPSELMQPNSSVDVKLEIADPGSRPSGYSINLE